VRNAGRSTPAPGTDALFSALELDFHNSDTNSHKPDTNPHNREAAPHNSDLIFTNIEVFFTNSDVVYDNIIVNYDNIVTPEKKAFGRCRIRNEVAEKISNGPI